jgi:hypothetical protein
MGRVAAMSPLAELGAAGTILDDLPEYERAPKLTTMGRGRRDFSKPLSRRGKPLPESACYCAACLAARPASRKFLEQERRTLRRLPVPR